MRKEENMKKVSVIVVMLFVLLFVLTMMACCYDAKDGLQFEDYCVLFCNDAMSKKMNASFSTSLSKKLYDFTGNANYLLCYDSSLDSYGVMNVDSGTIMERSDGLIYNGYLEYKCYYGGYNSYFYEKDNVIYSVDGQGEISVEDAYTRFEDYSVELMNAAIEESQFKNREDIKNYVNEELRPNDVRISKCARDKAEYADELYYNTLVLCNNMYNGTCQEGKICRVSGVDIGFATFYKFDGSKYDDTLFPINRKGTCGIVAAAMLLQYYERFEIANTVAPSIYAQATTSLEDGGIYSKSKIVSEILHDEINAVHTEVLGGSTFTSVKDAINSYFSKNSLKDVRATSSLGYASIKAAIDNGDPCIVFIRSCSLDILNNDSSTYSSYEVTGGHAMYTYGYTLTAFNFIDEFVCHAGYADSNYFYSVTYVAKLNVVGNVRLLY